MNSVKILHAVRSAITAIAELLVFLTRRIFLLPSATNVRKKRSALRFTKVDGLLNNASDYRTIGLLTLTLTLVHRSVIPIHR